MRRIEISEVVWEAMKKQGEFGETADDVLRRVFGVGSGDASENGAVRGHSRERVADRRLSARIIGTTLEYGFADEGLRRAHLPSKDDKRGLRLVLEEALAYARTGGASVGQLNALRKTLTEHGYHLTK